MNFDEYIGIPFKENGTTKDGCDCWRLICLIYSEVLGIGLPGYPEVNFETSIESLKKITKLFRKDKEKWVKVDSPELFDVILLRTGKMLYHAGMVIDKNRMIHIDRGINSTIEKFNSPLWKDKIEGYYRYAG